MVYSGRKKGTVVLCETLFVIRTDHAAGRHAKCKPAAQQKGDPQPSGRFGGGVLQTEKEWRCDRWAILALFEDRPQGRLGRLAYWCIQHGFRQGRLGEVECQKADNEYHSRQCCLAFQLTSMNKRRFVWVLPPAEMRAIYLAHTWGISGGGSPCPWLADNDEELMLPRLL